MKAYRLVLVAGFALALEAQDPAPFVAGPISDAPAIATNLLKNGSFEDGSLDLGRPPDSWGFIVESGRQVNGGITEDAAHNGQRAVGLSTPIWPTDRWQVLAFNTPVEGKSTYQYSAWVKAYPKDPLYGGARGFISIEWKDHKGAEISRIPGDNWDHSRLAGGEWIPVKVKGTAPANAVTATFTITYYLHPTARSGGSFLVDDALAEKVSK
jgi:hypothetical protein